MKVYTMCSPSHEPLLDLWMDSLVNEPLIEPRVFHVDMPTGNGDYGNSAHMAINELGSRMIGQLIEENLGSKIGFTGVDVVFMAPFVRGIEHRLERNSFLFQRERSTADLICPDVMFVNCTWGAIHGWNRWLDRFEQWDGHLPEQDRLIRESLDSCYIDLLPQSFSNPDNGGWNKGSVLFHANNSPPPGSVNKKLEMLIAMRGMF